MRKLITGQYANLHLNRGHNTDRNIARDAEWGATYVTNKQTNLARDAEKGVAVLTKLVNESPIIYNISELHGMQ